MPAEKGEVGYYYAILRYCPDISTEELLNIGILMWIPEIDAILWYLERRTDRLEECFRRFNKDNFLQAIDGLAYRFRKRQQLYPCPLSLAQQEELGITPDGRFPQILRSFCDELIFPWSDPRGGICTDSVKRMNGIIEEMIGINQPPETVTVTGGKFPELEWIWLNPPVPLDGNFRDSRWSALVPKGDRDNKYAYGYVLRLNDGRWRPEVVSDKYGRVTLSLEPSEVYAMEAVRREIEKQFKTS